MEPAVVDSEASGNWVGEISAVLLGLRSTVKEGLGTSAAEVVYGETLRLPGSLISTPMDPPSPAFVDDVRRHAYGSLFTPATHNGSKGFFVVQRLSELPPTSSSARIRFALL